MMSSEAAATYFPCLKCVCCLGNFYVTATRMYHVVEIFLNVTKYTLKLLVVILRRHLKTIKLFIMLSSFWQLGGVLFQLFLLVEYEITISKGLVQHS